MSGEELNYKYPIAYCPSCHRTVLYSDDPRDKKDVSVRIADENYHGKTMLCAKCKSMLIVTEKPKVAQGYLAIPIISESAI